MIALSPFLFFVFFPLHLLFFIIKVYNKWIKLISNNQFFPNLRSNQKIKLKKKKIAKNGSSPFFNDTILREELGKQ